MNRLLHPLIACLILSGTIAAAGKEPPVQLPEAAIKEYLAHYHLPLIEPGPKTKSGRDRSSQWFKWFDRAITTPFASQLKVEEPVRQRARKFVDNSVRLMRYGVRERDFTFTATDMAAEAAALVKDGIDDPLVYWLQCWAINASTLNFREAEGVFKKAWTHKRIKETPGALRLIMLSSFAMVSRDARQTSKLEPKESDMIAAAWEAVHDKTYLPEEDEVCLENLEPVFQRQVFETDVPRMKALCEMPGQTDWLHEMYLATYHNNLAWMARGNGWASSVTDKGWKGFEENRDIAVQHYISAWKLRPERSEPASHLLGVCLTGGKVEGGAGTWLKRATEAQLDDYDTISALLNGCLPRWGGSHEVMMGFGMAYALTKRFDTEAPYNFFYALRDVTNDGVDWRETLRQPLFAQVVLALCQQRVNDAPTLALKRDEQAVLASYAWMCGDYKTAAAALAEVPRPFTRRAKVRVMGFGGWSEDLVRGESAICAAGLEKEWRAAEKDMADKKLDAAETGYQKILSAVKDKDGELVQGQLAAIKFERALAKGGWVPLEIAPGLAGWQVQKGDWTGTADGRLVNRGRGTSAFIYHRGRVGQEFQIRGEYESKSAGLGVVLGQGYNEDHNEKWITCIQDGSTARLLDCYLASQSSEKAFDKPDGRSSFTITCHDGAISYELGGKPVFTNEVAHDGRSDHETLRLMPDGHVGFCHYAFNNGETTTLLKCEVRLLPADFKAGSTEQR